MYAFFYCLYELVIFAINPFKNIAIGYVRRDTVIAKYSYDMKPLYDMHLFFSYALVGGGTHTPCKEALQDST